MKAARKFTQVSRRFYRPECYHCPVCQKRLRRAVTLSERTVVTLKGSCALCVVTGSSSA